MEIQYIKSLNVESNSGGAIDAPARFGDEDAPVLERSFENISSILNQSFCNVDYVPNVQTYLDALQGYGVGMIVYGVIAVIITICISLTSIRHIIQNGEHKSRIVFIHATYPVVSITLLTTLVVPRAGILAEAVSQCMFTFSMYQLFCLFISYCGGESELIRTSKPDALNLKVGPCCCYPCCLLPVYTANKKNIRFLRLLVLQFPVVHAFVYIIFLFSWADQKNYVSQDFYIQPILVCSILLGIWGIMMTVKMLEHRLENHKLIQKFLSLQCILLCTKLQGVIVKIIIFLDVLPCNPPLTPLLYATIVFNSIVLLEIILLSLWAKRLYQEPLPDVEPHHNGVQQVCSIQTVCTNNSTDKLPDTPTLPLSSSGRSNNNYMCFDNQNFAINIKM